MTVRVNNPPALPRTLDAPGMFISQLIREFIAHAVRLNVALTNDGTEVAVAPVRLMSYTVSTLPSASQYAQGIIYVSNGTSNKRLAVSDGTNWRFPDGNIVS